jgi:acyl-CoA thioesterase
MAFNRLLGFELARVHSDGLTLQCRIRKELLNSVGVLHGGVAASLADTAVGSALFHRFGGKRPSTTVEFKINYFRPIAEGRLLARARFLRMGSTLCIGQVDLVDEQGREVGVAIVTYMFLDARKASS